MQSVATTRLSGAFALGIGLALIAWLVWLLPQVIRERDTGGIVVLSGFCLAAGALVVCGLNWIWYRKTVVIDDRSVRIQIRTLRGTRERTAPVARYEAVVQMDSRIQWWRFSSLVLPDPDPDLSVCVAMTARGSPELPALHDHFAKLLRLRKETTLWKMD